MAFPLLQVGTQLISQSPIPSTGPLPVMEHFQHRYCVSHVKTDHSAKPLAYAVMALAPSRAKTPPPPRIEGNCPAMGTIMLIVGLPAKAWSCHRAELHRRQRPHGASPEAKIKARQSLSTS